MQLFDQGPAVLWVHGKIVKLGTLPGFADYAQVNSINNAGQAVGFSCVDPCAGFSSGEGHGFLWENNGPMVDLNDLVQPPSDIVVADAFQIDDRGEIVAAAGLPNGDTHVVVLVPSGDCDSSCEQRIEESRNNPPVVRPATTGTTMPRFGKADWLRNPFGPRPDVLTPPVRPFN